jgi:hypothetical protein
VGIDSPGISSIGAKYHDLRAEIMKRSDQGLTTTYNRLHDPDERSPDILQLRELHAAMDRAVLDAYGWHDLAQTATCEFLLDYEDDENEEEPTGRARTRKKPWRYRWSDDFRDEVLARLLALNVERLAVIEAAAKEAAAKKHISTGKTGTSKKLQKPSKSKNATGDLFRQQHDRDRFYILMLLRAWNKPITRHALDAGLILMLNDEIRAGLLRKSKALKKSAKPRIVVGLDHVLQELQTLGYLEIDNHGPQQLLTLLPKAPPTDSATAEDVKRIGEVKRYFESQRANGNVTDCEEHIDAKPDFVSA